MPAGKPRRRRRSLTMSKKTPAFRRVQEKAEEEIAFARMIPAGAFTVAVLVIDQHYHGYTYRDVTFRKGDDVVLNSPFDETEDIWVGQICKIRTSPDQQNTLVKVRWYWSRNDIAAQNKCFDPSQCAPYERVLSDHYDYVSPYAFQDVVHVYEYDDSSLDPPMLGPRDFFVRTTFLHRKKTLKPRLGAETCLCQAAYNPFPSELVLRTAEGTRLPHRLPDHRDVMHFCPSLKCRKWYHSSCLQTIRGNTDVLPTETRGLRLLAVNPDEEVLYTTLEYFYEQDALDNVPSTDKVSIHAALLMLDRSPDIVAHLPQSVLVIAQRPIVRCSGAPAGFAIGNVSDVVLARRLVYAAVQNSGNPASTDRFAELLQREQARSDHVLWPGAEEDDAEFSARIARLGEEMDELGLLATPYERYWERRKEEYEALEELFEGPALVCPKCRGAI
ncbi:hypothetical protein BD414DRAFT_455692 [Trametes punicea]|nr:hypothetical protein BD414DRAFT_455692 [Trametes punicea]